MKDAKSPGVTEASTKSSKEVRQLVIGPSALWAAPEKVMGKAVRGKSTMKQRPWMLEMKPEQQGEPVQGRHHVDCSHQDSSRHCHPGTRPRH